MKLRYSSSHLKLLESAVILTFSVAALIPGARAVEKTRGKPWQAVYLAGVAPFAPGINVQVTIDQDQLRLRPIKADPFVVPVSAIAMVSTNVKGSHPATRAEGNFLRGFMSDAHPCYPPQGCGAVVMFTAALMLASYPVKSHDYLVSILWREGAADEEILFRVRRDEYTPLLAKLERATGKTWKNMDTEWAKVQQEIQSQQGSKTPIQLDRKVRVSKIELKPGRYQIVLLEREGSRGELYFFPGEQVNIEHLSVATWVEIAPPAPDATSTPVTYKEKDGTSVLAEIRTASKTLRFHD